MTCFDCKIIQIYERCDGVNKMQIERQNLKSGTVRFRLNIDIRKEMEDLKCT